MQAKVICAALSVVTFCCSQLAVSAAAECPPSGYSQAALLALKAREFAVPDDTERDTLALALVPCLAVSDPTLRDDVAFAVLSNFMRGKQLRTATAVKLMEQLLPWLDAAYPDPQGVAKPFAALVLAEVARMDRVAPFMSAAQRAALLNAGTQYLQQVRDYRGFDAAIGWRHGVAHGADFLMQLTLNPQIDRAGLERVLAALATQVVPQTGSGAPHFYVYGESQRLARPAFYAAQRHLLPAEVWRTWIQAIASPTPLAQWSDAYNSQTGLAKRHNTWAFLSALYVLVQQAGDEQTKAVLLPLLTEALNQIV
jgi:hypothetical protein